MPDSRGATAPLRGGLSTRTVASGHGNGNKSIAICGPDVGTWPARTRYEAPSTITSCARWRLLVFSPSSALTTPMPVSRARRCASAPKPGRYMTSVGPCDGRGALPTALILYPRARMASASAPAAPDWPFPFRTTTRVLVRGRAACWTGFDAAGRGCWGATAARAPCLVTVCPSATVPTTIRPTSSRAATPAATIAAVRQRKSGNGTACSTGASDSLRGGGLLQALPRQFQPLLEGRLRAPAELARREAWIRDAALDLARPLVAVVRLAVDAGHAPAGNVQLVDRRLDARADVVDAAGVLDRRQHAADDVADVDEIARLPAVAVDRRRLARRHPLEEDRDHTALERGLLPRAVDVRESQRDVVRAEEPVPTADVFLAGELRDPVRRDRLPRRVLRRRPVALAVDRPAGRAEDDVRPVRASRLQNLHGAEHVHLGVVFRPFDRCADVGLRREVDADLGPHRREQLTRVRADVADVQLRAFRHLLAATGHERVEHVYVFAAGDQRLGDMRADEARPPGDDRPQGSVS